MIAASARHADILKALRRDHEEAFESQVDVLLFKAATNGHASVVQYIVKYGVDFEFQDDLTEMTPLQSAIANGHEGFIHSLLQSGFDIDQRDLSGATALHRSIEQGDLSMTTCLIACGASIEAKYQDKMSLDLAIIAGHVAITEYLLA